MSPSDELRDRWRRVEAHLRAALALVEVEPETRRWTDEYLDHNELGLAFQTLASALADAGTTLPPTAREHLGAAAAEMGLDDDGDWRRLNAGLP